MEQAETRGGRKLEDDLTQPVGWFHATSPGWNEWKPGWLIKSQDGYTAIWNGKTGPEAERHAARGMGREIMAMFSELTA
jgi:hypothetical protein